jgi:Tat protein secretion system quality control protein TatD with DNase activity
VRHVAEFIAQLRGVAPEVIAEATTANFERVFLRGAA